MAKEISTDLINQFSDQTNSDAHGQVIKNAMIKNGIHAVVENSDAISAMNKVFSEEIETGKVSNQKQSGRCWMFAALNTFRHKMNDLFKLKDFELSQNHTNFWDKFEKANFFLESIIETAHEPREGRLVSFLLATPQQDGGQWDMLVSLINKYGVVPKQVMPETYQSSRSREVNTVLNAKLRQDAIILREKVNEGRLSGEIENIKVGMLSEIYKILVFTLGEPPKTFDFEFRDEDNEFHREQGITPQEFYKKYVNLNLDDYVSIINAPTDDKPFGKTYTVQYLGNVINGKPIQYLNVDMTTLKQLAVNQIKDQESVWFGCDVGKFSDTPQGIMDTSLLNYEEAFGISLHMSKAERLDSLDSCLTHAMVLTGVNLVDGKPNRWKVENSWGDRVGDKGYFVMSDAWMDEYTYQVVVNKKYLSHELKEALEQEPIALAPWDPMGSLARFN